MHLYIYIYLYFSSSPLRKPINCLIKLVSDFQKLLRRCQRACGEDREDKNKAVLSAGRRKRDLLLKDGVVLWRPLQGCLCVGSFGAALQIRQAASRGEVPAFVRSRGSFFRRPLSAAVSERPGARGSGRWRGPPRFRTATSGEKTPFAFLGSVVPSASFSDGAEEARERSLYKRSESFAEVPFSFTRFDWPVTNRWPGRRFRLGPRFPRPSPSHQPTRTVLFCEGKISMPTLIARAVVPPSWRASGCHVSAPGTSPAVHLPRSP